MTKQTISQRDEAIERELEQMGFNEINTSHIGVTASITEYFKTTKINTNRLRKFYGEIGDKDLVAALQEVIELFELQEKFNSPKESYWYISFYSDSKAVNSYFLGGNPEMEGEGENWFLDFCGQLEKMGFEEKGEDIKITAVFSKQQAIEKAKKIIWGQYKNREESFQKIKMDLQERIEHVIQKHCEKYQ